MIPSSETDTNITGIKHFLSEELLPPTSSNNITSPMLNNDNTIFQIPSYRKSHIHAAADSNIGTDSMDHINNYFQSTDNNSMYDTVLPALGRYYLY